MNENINNDIEVVEIGITQLRMTREVKKSTLIFNIIAGIFMVAVGVIGLFINPLKTAYSLTWAFGFILMFIGISVFVTAFAVRKQGVKEWWILIVQGILTFIIGIYLMTSPVMELVTLVRIFGFMLVFFGIVKLFVSREEWIFAVLQIILGIIMFAQTGYFLVWGFVMIFILFIINGIYAIAISAMALGKKK